MQMMLTFQQAIGAPALTGYMSPRLSSPAHPSSGGGAAGLGGGRGAGRGRGIRREEQLFGQTVRIVQGPYKGMCNL